MLKDKRKGQNGCWQLAASLVFLWALSTARAADNPGNKQPQKAGGNPNIRWAASQTLETGMLKLRKDYRALPVEAFRSMLTNEIGESGRYLEDFMERHAIHRMKLEESENGNDLSAVVMENGNVAGAYMGFFNDETFDGKVFEIEFSNLVQDRKKAAKTLLEFLKVDSRNKGVSKLRLKTNPDDLILPEVLMELDFSLDKFDSKEDDGTGTWSWSYDLTLGQRDYRFMLNERIATQVHVLKYAFGKPEYILSAMSEWILLVKEIEVCVVVIETTGAEREKEMYGSTLTTSLGDATPIERKRAIKFVEKRSRTSADPLEQNMVDITSPDSITYLASSACTSSVVGVVRAHRDEDMSQVVVDFLGATESVGCYARMLLLSDLMLYAKQNNLEEVVLPSVARDDMDTIRAALELGFSLDNKTSDGYAMSWESDKTENIDARMQTRMLQNRLKALKRLAGRPLVDAVGLIDSIDAARVHAHYNADRLRKTEGLLFLHGGAVLAVLALAYLVREIRKARRRSAIMRRARMIHVLNDEATQSGEQHVVDVAQVAPDVQMEVGDGSHP